MIQQSHSWVQSQRTFKKGYWNRHVHSSINLHGQDRETAQVPITDESLQKMRCIRNGILFSREEEGNPVICYNTDGPWGFPGASAVKNPAASGGDTGSIPGSRRFPWRRNQQPTPVVLPGKSHGQRSLAGYSLWGHKESNMTEHMHTCTWAHTQIQLKLKCKLSRNHIEPNMPYTDKDYAIYSLQNTMKNLIF